MGKNEKSLCRVFHVSVTGLAKVFIATNKFSGKAGSSEWKTCKLCNKCFVVSSSSSKWQVEQHLFDSHSEVILTHLSKETVHFSTSHVQDLVVDGNVLGTHVGSAEGVARTFTLVFAPRSSAPNVIEASRFTLCDVSFEKLIDYRLWISTKNDTRALSLPVTIKTEFVSRSDSTNRKVECVQLEGTLAAWHPPQLICISSPIDFIVIDPRAFEVIESFSLLNDERIVQIAANPVSSSQPTVELTVLTDQGRFLLFDVKVGEEFESNPPGSFDLSFQNLQTMKALVLSQQLPFYSVTPVSFVPEEVGETVGRARLGWLTPSVSYPFSIALHTAPCHVSKVDVTLLFAAKKEQLLKRPEYANCLDAHPDKAAGAVELQTIDLVSSDAGEYSADYKATNVLVDDSSGLSLCFVS